MNRFFCIGSLLLLGSIAVNANSWEQLDDARWVGRSSHAAVTLSSGEIVVTGGRDDNYKRLNDVWISNDKGNSWTEQTSNAGWDPRREHVTVALPTGEIVVMGGYTIYYPTDVWISDDKGISWTEQTSNAGWSGRMEHTAVVLPTGEIIVMGGRIGSFNRLNDVWISDDKGQSWKQQTGNAPWTARSNHVTVILPTGEIVIMGGLDGKNRLNDVWISDDKGISWTEQTHNAMWTERDGHVAVALPTGEIVVMGGFDGTIRLNDVWVSNDKGQNWQQLSNAEWNGKVNHDAVVLSDDEIIVMGGYDGNRMNDIWIYKGLKSFS